MFDADMQRPDDRSRGRRGALPLAVASAVFGVFGLLLFVILVPSLIGLVFGLIALRLVHGQNDRTVRGLAIAGTSAGGVVVAVWIVLGLVALIESTHPTHPDVVVGARGAYRYTVPDGFASTGPLVGREQSHLEPWCTSVRGCTQTCLVECLPALDARDRIDVSLVADGASGMARRLAQFRAGAHRHGALLSTDNNVSSGLAYRFDYPNGSATFSRTYLIPSALGLVKVDCMSTDRGAEFVASACESVIGSLVVRPWAAGHQQQRATPVTGQGAA